MKRIVNVWIFLAMFVVSISTSIAAPQSPSQVLKENVDALLLILQEPGYADPETRPPLRKKMESYINASFDFYEFSARAVGSHWKAMNKSQQDRLEDAFTELLLAVYLDRVNSYNGERVQYEKELISTRGNRAEVQTVVTLSNGTQVSVDYRMMLKNNAWVIYDVLIEHVSLIKNYRSQFAEILRKGNPDELIRRIEEQVIETKVKQQ